MNRCFLAGDAAGRATPGGYPGRSANAVAAEAEAGSHRVTGPSRRPLDGHTTSKSEVQYHVVDGTEAGRLALSQGHRDFAELATPLQNKAGEHDITLELTGRIALDWFRLR